MLSAPSRSSTRGWEALIDLKDAKEWSEVAKNIVEALAIVGGDWAIFQWIYSRRDRGTDVLLSLEERFSKLAEGRDTVEDDVAYKDVEQCLLTCDSTADELTPIDALLRFYVVLLGIIKARQASEAVLSNSYRYWLALYYKRSRAAYRKYIDTYYPTVLHSRAALENGGPVSSCHAERG